MCHNLPRDNKFSDKIAISNILCHKRFNSYMFSKEKKLLYKYSVSKFFV
jgi:hypothetical protein